MAGATWPGAEWCVGEHVHVDDHDHDANVVVVPASEYGRSCVLVRLRFDDCYASFRSALGGCRLI